MKYTIKDEKGNMICSIENVDPTKSTEMGEAKFWWLFAAGAALVAFGKVAISNSIEKRKKKKQENDPEYQKRIKEENERKLLEQEKIEQENAKQKIAEAEKRYNEFKNTPEYKKYITNIKAATQDIYKTVSASIKNFKTELAKSNDNNITNNLNIINKFIYNYSISDIQNIICDEIIYKIKDPSYEINLLLIDIINMSDLSDFNKDIYDLIFNEINECWEKTNIPSSKWLNKNDTIDGYGWESHTLNFDLTELFK